MNAYRRPGSQFAAMRAASARAVPASRNSSTKRILFSSADVGARERVELVRVRLAEPGQHLQGRRRLDLVDARHGEANVDEHPGTGLRLVLGQQGDVDGAPYADHVHHGQVRPVWRDLNDLAGYAQAHGSHSR